MSGTQYRFTTNARPGDYRSGIEPMQAERAAIRRADRWLVPLIIGLFIAGTLAVVAVT